MRIVVFGAGGRAGRRIVAEAGTRGHEVTGVSHRPGDWTVGDVTDPASVASLVTGQDVVVMAASRYEPGFFPRAATALTAGMAKAGVARLVAVGIGTTLETPEGVPLYETPGFPEDARAFTLGHVEELGVLRESGLDWVVLAPPPLFLNDEPATGRHRLGGRTSPADETFGYADLAAAVVDEAELPTRHRELVSVTTL
ncbi:NAD(P)-dependent oxidoreductase [Herbidospora cretacea]|uniref:NAD(P)-dependent oxidoreductase n=1 Tax=Herbidospora cretacea TaxID=28444 RepID=UPI0004C39255|nr:NAD(P)H-binding protein [Herbidospora cretacea]